jgi:hypothetical protein
MATEPNYIVVRPAPDLPAGFLPEALNGIWFDLSQLPSDPGLTGVRMGAAVAVPSGRFEQREDGAVAEVYEVRP